jgi:hypothetical protein
MTRQEAGKGSKEMDVRKWANGFLHSGKRKVGIVCAAILALSIGMVYGNAARADETCMSPYMAKITGSEDFVYVWTLGAEGIGDGSDKLVTIDVREGSKTYGKVIHSVSVGGRHEAHHAGLTDDRRYLWAGGRRGGASYLLRPSRPDADLGAFERQRPRRTHSAGGI